MPLSVYFLSTFFSYSSHYWVLVSYFLTASKVICIFTRTTGMVLSIEADGKTLAFKMDYLDFFVGRFTNAKGNFMKRWIFFYRVSKLEGKLLAGCLSKFGKISACIVSVRRNLIKNCRISYGRLEKNFLIKWRLEKWYFRV